MNFNLQIDNSLNGIGNNKADFYSDFGPVFTQFKNKPKEAIIHLMKIKKGECISAFYRKEIGFIDLVWGENNERNEGYGLKHIIEKHEKEIAELGFKIADFLPIVIQYGDFKLSESKDKVLLESSMFRVVISTRWFGKEKKLVISTFDLRKKPRNKN